MVHVPKLGEWISKVVFSTENGDRGAYLDFGIHTGTEQEVSTLGEEADRRYTLVVTSLAHVSTSLT